MMKVSGIEFYNFSWGQVCCWPGILFSTFLGLVGGGWSWQNDKAQEIRKASGIEFYYCP